MNRNVTNKKAYEMLEIFKNWEWQVSIASSFTLYGDKIRFVCAKTFADQEETRHVQVYSSYRSHNHK